MNKFEHLDSVKSASENILQDWMLINYILFFFYNLKVPLK